MSPENEREPLRQADIKEDDWVQRQSVSEVAAELFEKSRRALLLYYFFTVGTGAFIIFLMIGELFWKNSSDTHPFLLCFCYLFFALGMLFARSAGEYGRMLHAWKASAQVMREYCFLQYKKSRRSVWKYTMLFLMAKCDIYSGRLAEAGEELNRVNYYAIPAVNQAAYHLLWALIDRFSGQQEEYEKNVEVYRQMVMAQGKRLPRGEERLRILLRGNETELRGLTDIRKDLGLSKEKAFWSSVFLFSLFFLLLLVAGKELLTTGLEFRNWFLILGCGLFQILAFVSGLLVLVKGHLVQKKLGNSGAVGRVLGILGLIVMIFLFLVNDFLGMLSLNKEKILPDGRILVERQYFFGPSDYWVCEPWGLVFRRYLYRSNDWGLKDDGSREFDEAQEDDDVQENGGADGDSILQEQSPDVSEDERKREAYQAIYESGVLKASGELTFSYSAKGELYALVGEPYDASCMGETTKAQCRLVYDRLSKNGLCYEIVCYEDHKRPGEEKVYTTTISDIYAVVIDTGKVISSGRTSWADVGNDEYRQATGE